MPELGQPVPRVTRMIVGLASFSSFAAGWGYLVFEFGWVGGVLGWWPAAVFAGGGALGVVQVMDMVRRRRAERARLLAERPADRAQG